MRAVLLSDIHANSHALQSTLAYIEAHLTNKEYWILGDLLGRGPFPVQVWRAVESLNPALWLAGNHDWYIGIQNPDDPTSRSLLRGPIYAINPMTGERERADGPNDDAWKAALIHRKDLPIEILHALTRLECRRAVSERLFAAHAMYCCANRTGELVWLEEYVDSPSQAERLYLATDAPWHTLDASQPIVHVSGHTHIPGLWSRPHAPCEGNAFSLWTIEHPGTDFAFNTPIPLESSRFYHINPGSVGMPATRVCFPNFALLETDPYQVTYYQVDNAHYDVEIVRNKMKKLGYPENLYTLNQMKPCP